MSKLIYANISRVKKDVTFRLCIIFMVVAGTFVSLKTTTELPIDRVFFVYAVMIGLVSSVFCSLFIGVEHGDGTIRNKLIVGHTRKSIYFANLVVCSIAGLIFCFSFMLPMLTLGIFRLGVFTRNMSWVVLLLITTVALSIAFTSIYILISMLCQNKAITSVACILSFIVLLCIALKINSDLQQPPMQNNYVMSIGGVEEVDNRPNPNYISGIKREMYQFILDFLPTGQSVQFIELEMVHTWQLPLYSFLVVVITSCIGSIVFQKKNIK